MLEPPGGSHVSPPPRRVSVTKPLENGNPRAASASLRAALKGRGRSPRAGQWGRVGPAQLEGPGGEQPPRGAAAGAAGSGAAAPSDRRTEAFVPAIARRERRTGFLWLALNG